jgi:DNA-binding response OmpR family regulator
MHKVLFEIQLGDDTLQVQENRISSSLCTIPLSSMEGVVMRTLCQNMGALIPSAELLVHIRDAQPPHMQPMRNASYIVRKVRVKLAAVTNNKVRIVSKYREGYRLTSP